MKKLISLFLALLLCVTSLTPAFASEITTSAVIHNGIAAALNTVEANKNNIGLSDVNFTNLRIGNEIIMYEHTANGLSELRSCYPLFHQDSLVALAIDIGNQKFQVSTQLAQAIDSLQLENIAIVYDNMGVYAYDNSDFYFLAESPIPAEGRLSISSSSPLSTETLELSNLDNSVPLSYSSNTVSNARTGVMATCAINHVLQLGTYTCWAAVVASIVNYKNGTNLSDFDVAEDYFGSNASLDQSLDRSLISGFMSNQYGVSGYVYQQYAPSAGIIYNNLNSGYPIYASFTAVGANLGHACTIFSIHMLDGYIVLMDPAIDSYQYCYYTNGAFSYVHELNGRTYSLTTAICRYWT